MLPLLQTGIVFKKTTRCCYKGFFVKVGHKGASRVELELEVLGWKSKIRKV